MNIKELKKYVLERRKDIIKSRDCSRGTGVYLGENIGAYYMQVGEFFEIEKLCTLLNLKVESYDPFETEEDDERFNYWGAYGAIGIKECEG